MTRRNNSMNFDAATHDFDAKTLAALHAGFASVAKAAEKPASKLAHFGSLYGASQPMQDLFKLIEKVAPTRAPVLIIGESGTGKELVACTIHEMSRQSGKPMVAINCGAIPANLIEAELFGHERGSFTGAVRQHKGCFERAAGGTLFLDEVTEMPLDMQVKLLRVLEAGRFSRVGGDEELEAGVRIIAATNRRPDEAVAAGLLRADLLYRLSVFPIEVPALRERGEDVQLLAKVFLDELNEEEGSEKRIGASSMQFIAEHRWSGNVRELKNAVQRAFILADEELDLSNSIDYMKLSAAAVPSPAGCIPVQLGSRLADAERSLIFATLEHCGGNKTRTAGMLGVSLKTLYNRLNEYQAERSPLLQAV